MRVIGPPPSDVKKTLEEVIAISEHLDAIIVVGLMKDGQQYLKTSSISGVEKAFLVQFLNAYMNRWFEFGD